MIVVRHNQLHCDLLLPLEQCAAPPPCLRALPACALHWHHVVQLLLALLAIAGVFVLVPRGVSVGTIDVHYTRMTFNTTTKTYRIILQADVPVYNNNYLQVCVSCHVMYQGPACVSECPTKCNDVRARAPMNRAMCTLQQQGCLSLACVCAN